MRYLLLSITLLIHPTQAAQLQAADDAEQNLADENNIIVEADTIHDNNNIIRARGNVMACFSEYTLHTDFIEYNRNLKTILSPRRFSLQSSQHKIDGSSFVYNASSQQGEVRGVNLLIGSDGLQAVGDVARVLPITDEVGDGQTTQNAPLQFFADNIAISSCKPESRNWVLEAKTLHYQGTVARAEDVVFRFYDVPVVYAPVFIIDSSMQKRSGILRPGAEISNNGFSAEIPFYIFLAENYDATFTPTWHSKHGLLLEGETRYLFGAHQGFISAGWTPLEDKTRLGRRLGHKWSAPHWRLEVAMEDVSDSFYYADFSDDADQIAMRNLPRRAALHYQNAQWEAAIIGEQFKTINYTGPPPHNVLPQIYARYLGGTGAYSTYSEWEYSNFMANRSGQIESERFLWRGEVTRQLSIDGLTLRPEVGFHAVKYGGYNAEFITPYARLLAETGYRPMPSGWGDYHLRGMVAYAPHTKQSDAPLFDTTLRELQSGGIYNWNRFTGGDRAADAKVAAYGAEWRLWDAEAKREKFSLEIAQRFYLRRPRVTLPFERVLPGRGFANLLGAMKARLQDRWRLEATTEWNPEDNRWESTYADVRADFGSRRLLRFGGLFEEENSLLLGGTLPLGARIDMSFLLRYLGEEDRLAESEGALQIRSECDCWRLNLGARNIITARNETQKSYSIGMEFRGLGALGSNRYEKITAELR